MLTTTAAPPRIILLNGTSSAGKTSVGSELQTILDDEAHLLLGVDTFVGAFPNWLFSIGEGFHFEAAPH